MRLEIDFLAIEDVVESMSVQRVFQNNGWLYLYNRCGSPEKKAAFLDKLRL